MSRAAAEDTRQIRVYATPYAYTPNGAPLYIEYGGVHASLAAHAVHALRAASPPSPPSPVTGAPTHELRAPGSPPRAKRARSELSGAGAAAFAAGYGGAWHATHSGAHSGAHSGSSRRGGSSSEDGTRGAKKSRLVWTEPLHAKFVEAVQALGVDTAVPKQIMARMGVHSLTRENVASHLQKYRASVKRAARERAAAHLNAPLFRDEHPRAPDSLALFSAVAAGRPRAPPPPPAPPVAFHRHAPQPPQTQHAQYPVKTHPEQGERVLSPHAVMAPLAFASPRAPPPARAAPGGKDELQRLPSMKLAPLNG